MYPYLIVSPGLIRQHAGTRALKRLCDKLIEKGHKAKMSYEEGLDLKKYILEDDAIVFYPEIYHSVIVEAKRKVCWILNPQGVNNQEKEKFYWQGYNDSIPKGRILSVDIIDRGIFNNDKCEFRRWNTFYRGKGEMTVEVEHIKEVIDITKQYPVTVEELVALLKKSIYLYTCDAITALTTEARLVGTPVVFLENKGHNKEMLNLASNISMEGIALENTQEAKDKAMVECHEFKKHYEDYYSQEDSMIENFIEITQNI